MRFNRLKGKKYQVKKYPVLHKKIITMSELLLIVSFETLGIKKKTRVCKSVKTNFILLCCGLLAIKNHQTFFCWIFKVNRLWTKLHTRISKSRIVITRSESNFNAEFKFLARVFQKRFGVILNRDILSWARRA